MGQEYIKGPSLQQYLHNRIEEGNKLSDKEASLIIKQIL